MVDDHKVNRLLLIRTLELQQSGSALGGRRVRATAMFADIRGFTSLCAAQRTIQIDGDTLAAPPPDVQVEVLGEVPLKGLSEAVDVFSVDCGQKL